MKGKTPLVSVCIPAYNNSQYIEETISSVLKQTYQNLELVIVDDGSLDDTVNVIKSFSDSRIRLYQNSRNIGMTKNWNLSVELARGDFVKLICADDLLYPTAIEQEVAALLAHKTARLVVSNTALIDGKGKKRGVYKRQPGRGLKHGKRVAKLCLLVNNFFGAPCNTMFRKETFKKVGGFDEQFGYIPDFDLWIQLAVMGNVYIIRKVLNAFRLREDSNTGHLLSKSQKDYDKEHKKLLLKHRKRGELQYGEGFIRLSLLSRRIRNVLYGYYLKQVIRRG